MRLALYRPHDNEVNPRLLVAESRPKLLNIKTVPKPFVQTKDGWWRSHLQPPNRARRASGTRTRQSRCLSEVNSRTDAAIRICSANHARFRPLLPHGWQVDSLPKVALKVGQAPSSRSVAVCTFRRIDLITKFRPRKSTRCQRSDGMSARVLNPASHPSYRACRPIAITPGPQHPGTKVQKVPRSKHCPMTKPSGYFNIIVSMPCAFLLMRVCQKK